MFLPVALPKKTMQLHSDTLNVIVIVVTSIR